MQEELGDGEPVFAYDAARRHGGEVDHGEPGDHAEAVVGAGERFEVFGEALGAAALAERGDRGDTHLFVLARVQRQFDEATRGLGVLDEAEGLDEPCSGKRIGDPDERALDGGRDRLADRARPLLQRALSEHPRESACGDLRRQSPDRVEPRQPLPERPRGVLADGWARIRQQLRKSQRSLLVIDLRERVHAGDRGDIVVAGDGGGKHTKGANARVAAGFERQIVSQAHGIDDAGRFGDGVERGEDPHGVSVTLPTTRCRAALDANLPRCRSDEGSTPGLSVGTIRPRRLSHSGVSCAHS